MERKIYRSLCVTAISAALLAVALSAWVFYGFYAEQAEKGVRAEFSSMAVATLPSVCLIIIFILCGSLLIASRLTRSIVGPIEELGDRMLDKAEQPEQQYYSELAPFVSKIDSLQRQLEQQRTNDIRELEKMDLMRREFSANVSHELKTPITSISGFAEMIENGMAQSNEDCRLFAGRIVRESSRLLALVEDIMHLSRLDEESFPDLLPCSLAEVAEECIQFLRPLATRAEVQLLIDGTAPPIMGHRALLRELVQNLCENAIKYNHPGGHVWVKLERAEDCAILRVSDDGIGISPEHLDRIFQRFYRVDKSRSKQTGGTGLGLSIAKHITDQHRGAISVRSELAKGTEFTVSLPLSV